MNQKIHILGSGREVGRAAIAIEKAGRYVLLDYGVTFDEKDIPMLPLTIPPSSIDGVIITHAHLDHVGAAPLLYVSSKPRSYMTPITRDISRLMLYDFLKISSYYLPFEANEVERFIESSSSIGYREEIDMGSFKALFRDAGHIPGSTSVLLDTGGKRILYTGDVNTLETRLVGPADLDGLEAEVLIIEATYGDTDHAERSLVEERFVEAIREVVDGGGTVLVPAFSLSRSQEILALLAERLDSYMVSYDGMIRPITEIMLRYIGYIRKPEPLRKANNIFIQVDGWGMRRKIWREPGVIVASAGMLKGGPALYYLKRLASDKRSAIFLVSYQGKNTPGRMILEKGVFMENGPRVVARVEWFDFSAHAGRTGLLSIVKSIKGLEKVIVIHSDPEVGASFANKVKEEAGVDAILPGIGDVIEI
ncbi:MAG: MBL fold metallo-hydrolase [Desulfurococcales archaeon]|nr:MBL fold metallo-hydrolase [Desulfurococcales archaeon]